MSNQSLQDYRSQLAQLKRHLVAAMTDEQRLYQHYTEENREAERWKQKAEFALNKGAEELARGALTRSSRHLSRAAEYQRQYLEQKAHVERLKVRLLELETRPREQPAMPSRLADLAQLESNLARLERWEERAREERAMLAAWAELERDELTEKFSALEREAQLEQQLAELKKKLGKE